MYAVIEDSGTQIKVAEGDQILIDTRELADDQTNLTFDRVLMVSNGEGDAKVGDPVLAGATVDADIVEEGKTDKVDVVKFKRRKTYKRRNGHRQSYIKVAITKINA